MLVRVLIVWLVLLNLATACWWWAQAAPSAEAGAASAAATGHSTAAGLRWVREVPAPAPGSCADAGAEAAAQVDCVPLR